jgi:hypothetical protein
MLATITSVAGRCLGKLIPMSWPCHMQVPYMMSSIGLHTTRWNKTPGQSQAKAPDKEC